ncbi:MAG: DUF4962 domain-containing protein [Bryobacteraceae bacterium]|nr:DUF4962 domain-containing protein [Bryobacteraceae bacterium]
MFQALRLPCSVILIAGASALAASSLPIVEREPRAEELVAYPVDGTAAGVNPPGFCWTPHDRAASYRLEVAGASDPSRSVISAAGLTSTVYPPDRVLAPGAYVWRVVYRNADGADYGASKLRRFRLPAGLPELPMPDVKKLRDQLAGVRPRLFLNGDRLEQIRAAVKRGDVEQWDFFISAADAALQEGPYPEPAGYPNAEFNVEEWRRIYRPGKVGSAHLARTALAYKVTGDRKYLEGARRWLMNLMSWDPTGIISHDVPQVDGSEGNDEASMPLLERVAFAWDWIGHELTPAERARVLAVMPERGNQVLRLLKKQDFLSHPFENHEGRVLAFLGNAGLSFLGDLPEAEEWLDYVLRCYLTSFPGWGGDEGGWAQGIGYWSAYVSWLSSFAEALRAATDVDILRRPFYRHNGYFPIYFHPPYAPMGAFGDGGDSKPSLHEKLLIDYFAEVFHDPILKAHAVSIKPSRPKVTDAGEQRQWNEWFIEDVVSVWRAGAARVTPRGHQGERVSRHFADIGWTAMHTALGDPQNDVWAMFKSSRFGSFSHSHADQNTFQLHAWGEALAIDSGYYPSYGSPHHVLWTRQTRAHNGILVDGRGQPPFNWEAAGRIERFDDRGLVTIVRGQAAQAYNVAPDAGIVEMWRKHLTEPLPPMEPKVDSFNRTLVFIASRERPILFVHDYLKTAAPATSDWLLHSLNRMEVDAASASATVSAGKARMAVKLLATVPLEFSQFGGFPVKPEERAAGSPDQWHLSARGTGQTDEVKFLAALVPYREGERPPAIETIGGKRGVGFKIGNTEIAAYWGLLETGEIQAGDLQGPGRLIVRVVDDGQPRTIVSQ